MSVLSRERRTLQPWTRWALHDPRQGWLCWKVEDKYVSGLPDCVVKSPLQHVSVLELKWSTLKTAVRVECTREQWAHLREWGPRGFVLVAAPALDMIALVPAQGVKFQSLTIPAEDVLRGARGIVFCGCNKSSLKTMLRHHLL